MANNRLFIRNRKTGEFTSLLKSFGAEWEIRKTAVQIEKDVAELFDDASFGNCFDAATDLELVPEAAAMRLNPALRNTPRHFGQSLMTMTGAGSGCSDEH